MPKDNEHNDDSQETIKFQVNRTPNENSNLWKTVIMPHDRNRSDSHAHGQRYAVTDRKDSHYND